MHDQWVGNLFLVWWRLQQCLSGLVQGPALYCPHSTCTGWIFYVFWGTCWNIQLRGCRSDFGFWEWQECLQGKWLDLHLLLEWLHWEWILLSPWDDLPLGWVFCLQCHGKGDVLSRLFYKGSVMVRATTIQALPSICQAFVMGVRVTAFLGTWRG